MKKISEWTHQWKIFCNPDPRKQATEVYFSSIRSSHQRCSVKKCVLKNFAKFTGKQLYQSLFFNEVAGLKL